MKFAEFAWIVAAEIDEEEFERRIVLRCRCRRDVCQRNVISVGLFHDTPAVEMQALRIAPPLPAQIVVAILWYVADRETDVVQFDIRIAAIPADVEHEQLHRDQPIAASWSLVYQRLISLT